MLRILSQSSVVFFLTVLTQIGGLAWIVSLFFRRKMFIFPVAYIVLSLSAIWIAPIFGRIALSCLSDGPLQIQSWMYCALNRNYVTPELADVLEQTAQDMDQRFPGTVTLVLDANFPFLTGFPLIPHLSHDDGEKADIAFYYRDGTGYRKGATRSPVGYFAFEQGPTDCAPVWPTLRWDFRILQQVWRGYDLETDRTRAVLKILSNDDRVGKIFVEPHLVRTLNVSHPNIRFQGCRAARHDDHIHLQLR